MADIANSTVFTNGSSVSCGTSDLLRQAFQEVVDDEKRDSEFVAFLQDDGDDSPTIHLTHAQASALRLTFEVDTMDDQNDESLTYDNEESAILDEITRSTSLENSENSSCTDAPRETINYQNDNSLVKVECTSLDEWNEKGRSSSRDDSNETISINDLDISSSDDSARRRLLEQLTEGDEEPKIYLSQQNSHKSRDTNGVNRSDDARFNADVTRNFQRNDSQAQILQRLPIILPSSQFVVKPAQTLLKNTKTVRIVSGGGKIANTGSNSTNPSYNVGSIHKNANVTNQNSILLPKGAVLNALPPRLLNATPMTAQLINGAAISARLLNASQILTNPSEFSSQNNACATSASSLVAGTASKIVNSTIPLVTTLKTTAGIIRGSNNQRFVVPNLKTNQEAPCSAATAIQGTNASAVKTGITGSFLKSVQIPAQFLRNAPTAYAKSSPASATKITTATTNSPLILRTASILKAQESKTVASSILRPTAQNSSNPVSILKPQTKIVSRAISNDVQRVNANGQNIVASLGNNLTNSHYARRTTSCAQSETSERPKCGQNGTREKRNETALATAKIVKRAKVAGLNGPVALTAEQTDITKPLGSSENPIQIVQQGHTFHSMQRLTQSQLKQIARVLQQRSQEAAMPNERIVYRVVFPEELDLRMRNPGNLLKGRGAKRGRPKKTAVRPSAPATKISTATEEEHEDTKDDRKKVMARTRSGRLSRPPRHMVRDYKHLHHLDFTQPDLDDSDGGYSDYNTNGGEKQPANEQESKELLAGLEIPKRKISDHFRCPTCSKIYLGRARMARHFEMHPDHGSPEQLPPATSDSELKRATIAQDPLKRKGKKRGPWAYVTPEAKSERRQTKLREAIAVCESSEIIKIAAKPVLDSRSMYDLLILKSDHNVRNFLGELKELVDRIRERIGAMLSSTSDDAAAAAAAEHENYDLVNLNEENLCDALGLEPGLYRINNSSLRRPEEEIYDEHEASMTAASEPPKKLQKIEIPEDPKETFEERMSSGFSESSDMSVTDFFNERKIDTNNRNGNCPEVLMALTLMPRNLSPTETTRIIASTGSMSKLLISNPEIQNQLSENQGFQKIDINSSKPRASYRKFDPTRDNFTKISDEATIISDCTSVFDKFNVSRVPATKETLHRRSFIKLETPERGFKLNDTSASDYAKESSDNYEKITNEYATALGSETENFVKGFQKLITKIVAPLSGENEASNGGEPRLVANEEKIINDSGICRINDDLPILRDSVPIMGNSCDASIFGSTDNLDIGKITGYDHITNLDILGSGVGIDEKLVEQLELVDQTSLVDELVSERLKNIMPDNILDNNLITNGGNLDADLDFEALSEEFNRNTRS